MAKVKLFHVTEFAESVFQSPLSHRTAIHPLWIMLLVALWVATVGHWPLWLTLAGQAQVGAASLSMLAILAAQLALGALLWLAPFGWRWTLKYAMTLMLFWSALGSCAMWLQRAAGESVAVSPGGLLQFLLNSDNWARLQSWPCVLTLLLLAALPAALLWRGRIRRIPFGSNLLLITILLVASYVLLIWLGGYVSHNLPSPIDPLVVWRQWFGAASSSP